MKTQQGFLRPGCVRACCPGPAPGQPPHSERDGVPCRACPIKSAPPVAHEMWSLFHTAFVCVEDPKTKREEWRLSIEGLMLVFRLVENPALFELYREFAQLVRIRNRSHWLE